jgi:integrase
VSIVFPLQDAAIALLGDVAEPDELVFAGAKAGKPLSDMSLSAVLRRMKVDPEVGTVHGFRSTFRDWAGETTAHAREVIEASLAHKLKDKAEAAYARGDLFAKRRKLMQDWADYLASAPADVLGLHDTVPQRETAQR